VNSDKAALRKEFRWQRSEHFIESSWLRILQCKEFSSVTHIASYLSYGVEPQTRDLNERLRQEGRTVLIPRMLANKDLEWVIWNGENEPTGEAVTDPSLINLIGVAIVPALRIDREGNRLGQGGGSYDRALPKLNAWKIALVHHGELTSEPVPHENHDQRMDAAATPDLVVRFT
jgi:5-formyltetrahydrofolate cyclo-ligase